MISALARAASLLTHTAHKKGKIAFSPLAVIGMAGFPYATNDRGKRLGTMTIGEKDHTSRKP